MIRAARLPVVLLLALALAAPGAGPAPAPVETVAQGLEVPWGLAFAPDGRLFVTERPGRLRVVHEGRLAPAPLATLPVAATGEGGLMGLALDPAFARSGHLYVCYTTPAGPDLVNRVARLTVREGRTADHRVILDGLPGARIHDGCRLGFGPDGKLYVTAGDAAEPRLAQRADSPAGKILRIEPDGGTPADNPLRGSPVFSLGHRNPQGLAWDGAGRLFAAEHGPSAHDEVNRIRPGRNYGWPEAAGRAGDGRYEDPLVESGSDTWAPSGLAALGPDLYVAALRGRKLLRIRVEGDGARLLPPLLDGTHGRLRAVVVGPDGALYVSTSNRDGRGSPAREDDRILRLRP
jgi:glucose/arabinose dehydrogenase